MGKVLALVCSKEHVIAVIPEMKRAQGNGDSVIVIGLEYEAQKALSNLRIDYKIPEDYTTERTYEKLDEEAMSLARKWHHFDPSVEDLVTYQGINLGELVEWEFTLFLAGVMKYVAMIKCIFDGEQPQRILLVNGEGEQPRGIREEDDEYLSLKAAALVAELMGIDTVVIEAPKPRRAKDIGSMVDRGLRALAEILVRTLNSTRELKARKAAKPRRILIARAVNYIGRVAEELRKGDSRCEIMIFATGNVISRKPKANLIYRLKAPRDYETKEICKRWEQASLAFKNNWLTLKKNERFRQSLTYSGTPLWKLVRDRFSYLLSARFPKLAKDIEIIKSMLDEEMIDLIVVPCEANEFEKTLIAVANQKTIPSLVVQREKWGHAHIWLPVCATKIACWGQITRDWLIEQGVSPDKIVITGAPRFDVYLRTDNRGINTGTIVLALGHSNKGGNFANLHLNPEEDKKILSAVIGAMKHFPDKQLVVKLHPGDRNASFKCSIAAKIMAELKLNNVQIVKEADIVSLLNSCDILITPCSTTGLEAMILNKPVITVLGLTGRKTFPAYVWSYPHSGAAIDVSTEDQLVTVIESILHDGKVSGNLSKMRKKYVQEAVYIQDCRASTRVADLIIQMIEESRKVKSAT